MAPGPSIGEAAGRVARSAALSDDVGSLRYVSGSREQALRRLGLVRVRDVLLHVPRRYLDFSKVVRIGAADVGTEATVVGVVDSVTLKRPRPRLSVTELMVADETGVMRASFFRQPWVAEQVRRGDRVALSGTVAFSFGFREMRSPFLEVLDADADGASHARVLPVHAVGEGVSVAWMRRIVSAALADAGDVCDFLPASLVAGHGLPTLGRALREVHFPPSVAAGERARRRLAYDELLCLQVALLARRHIDAGGAAPTSHVVDGPHLRALREALPFSLTDEQQAAARDILGDMAAPRPMSRLLLGDVGTGKTAVAALGLAACADSGTQAAMMAPTSVLARQYAGRLGPLLDEAGVGWVLITGATPPDERARALGGLASGKVTVAFGTTALLSDDVCFARLTLVVVDEQHRFGVGQRLALREKGAGADQLTMSATPIPRTLALSLYGDLDVSRIAHRPHAGAGVRTSSLPPENVDVALGAIRDACARGRQAYVVCPLVDEHDDPSELDDVPEQTRSAAKRIHGAVQTYEELAGRLLPELRVGLLHGRLSSEEKDAALERFAAGETDVLVCTTVVEVGIDVPNATVMLVLDADRFGLATLHQLRGRVGRGDERGDVYLACAARKGTPARRRLDALEATSDGFELAELDLRLRHEGELLGFRQSGGVSLSVCDLSTDGDLAAWAHDDARALVGRDPALASDELRPLAIEVRDRFGGYFEELGRA